MSASDIEVSVITGAAGTLGGAVARRLAGRSNRLVLVDVAPQAVERMAEELRAHCDSVTVVVADVSSEAGVESYVSAAVEVGDGLVHKFFNNAGVEGPQSALVDYPVSDFDSVIAVTCEVSSWG
jgi:NAD(P)-dependent dehydrogenase (short-subunit alcohol dehydrogenase family)